MRQTKMTVPFFALYDRTGMETYLEKQSESGWMLTQITALGWKFKKAEPRKRRFAVTYLPNASLYSTASYGEERAFADLCAYTGWTFLDRNSKYHVYYSEEADPTPIDTDPVLEVRNIHRVSKKTFLPAMFLLILNGLLQLASFAAKVRRYPVSTLTDRLAVTLAAGFALLLLLSIYELIQYGLWYRRAKTAAETGLFLETKSHRKLRFFLPVVLILLMLMVQSVVVLGVMVGLALCIPLGRWLLSKLQEELTSDFAIGALLVAALFLFILVWSVPVSIASAVFEEQMERQPFSRWDKYEEVPPLTISELYPDEMGQWQFYADARETVLGADYWSLQKLDEKRTFNYQIVEVKLPFLYGLCLEEAIDAYDDLGRKREEAFLPTDASPWLADAVYRLGTQNQWVLCYERYIITVCLDQEPDGEQMALIGHKLGGQ